MSFETIQHTERGFCVKGTTQFGRKVALTLIDNGENTRFETSVFPIEGYDQLGDRAIDIELSRVMAEQDAITARLAPVCGAAEDTREILRAAASILDRREVEPELIAMLVDLAPAPSAMP